MLSASCTKENTSDYYNAPCDTTFVQNYSYDTVYPSSYLMTYPGSWWAYDDGSIDSCFNWATVSISNNTNQGNCVTVYEDKKILPFSSFGYFSYVSKVVPYTNYKPTWIEPFLDTIPGTFMDYLFTDYVYDYLGDSVQTQTTIQKNVVEHLDSMEVGGVFYHDVIHVHTYHSINYYQLYNSPFWNYDYYFAKNIGIIRLSTANGNQIAETKNITNYYIAPH